MREVQVLQHDGNGDGATNHGGPACASMARSESQLDGKFLVLQKGARDIMSDSAETMPRQRGKRKTHTMARQFCKSISWILVRKSNDRYTRADCRASSSLRKESVTEQLQKTHCDRRRETHL
jgi:hypothetical protein